MKKGIFFICAVCAVVLFATNVYALDIYFEHRTTEELARGVVYEQNRMMTSRGMLDVHVLYVDVRQPHVSVAPVASSRELGLRETTSRMLSDAGAIAGINADFFNMARVHSTYFGPMVREGQVLSLNAGTNSESHDLATFFLDINNNPFFEYMRTHMRIYANNQFLTRIVSYNSIGSNIHSPVIVSRSAMYDTSEIDRRALYTLKVVVDNGVVTQTTFSTVETPENGFVIIIPHASLPYYERFLGVGTDVFFHVSTDINVDFSSIQAAIGGGSVVLNNGEVVGGAGVQPNARHPRTAVGAMRDGRMVLMVVDGRTHSIGVTNAELGAVLLHYGVVNAMHMDGGGSTTMVTRAQSGNFSVANTPSDGSQRRVTNALGVFDNSVAGDKVGIILIPAETRAIAGVPLAAEVFGVDYLGNRIPLYIEDSDSLFRAEAVFLANPEYGFWNNNVYTPLRTGTHRLEVRYGEMHAYTTIEVFSLGQLQPQHEVISLLEGGQIRLRFSGIATDGTQVNIPEVTGLRVSPAYLGSFENGYFTAIRGGTGYIQAAVGAVVAYIPVAIGGFPWPIDMFGGTHLGFLSTPPEYVSTTVTTETLAGRDVIRMDYSFGRTAATQAAYVTFYPALEIPGEPIALRMQVYGDDSGHWLRARVRDAEGNSHNIDFARELDFVGWETVIARLPNRPAPFTLDRIYMVTLESFEATRHLAIFYGLEALYAPNHDFDVPQGTVFTDRLRAATGFAGFPNGSHNALSIPSASDDVSFGVLGVSNMAVATITARGGGIQAANVQQWQNFMPNIRRLDLPYVVILLDESPFNFTRRMERDLFHHAMTQLNEEGRTVFVVSATADETTLIMRDNIRYINIARPESGNARIHFHSDGDRIWWND
ncbi:MAG: phosphodiester glycosidase family protein [Defluviitaleaceae bacterium]|nr:phosphodiester glycosidase family protein [Defluviitaleaceae bacterium]